MNLIYNLIIAFAMYSKIPMPHIDWTKERMRYVFCFFPVIGAVIGACMILWMKTGMRVTGNEDFFTAVLVLIPVVVAGGIHFDGFLDTCDALSSYKTMEEKLEILKDSHAGAFAILMGCCYFVLDYGVFHATDLRAIRLLAIGYVLSRAFSGLAIVVFKKARKSGLAATFSDSAQKKTVAVTMILYIAACAVLMVLTDPVIGSLCFLTALLVFGWYRYMSYQKFGGITGDLAGFFLQVCELAMAFVTVIAIHLIG